jgi:NDP-sugar pyrophosphorylase family protein
VLCTGYQSESVASYFEERPSLGHVRCSPEAKPLGTAGAVKQAECLIASDPFLVLNGDSLLPADLTQLVSFHKEKQAAITIVLTEVPDKTRFGSVLLTTDGSIVAFSEKGNQGPGLINAGIYLIDRAVLETIPSECEVSIERDVFPSFVGNGICGMVVPGTFVDIGTPEAYAMAQTAFPYQPEIGQR